MYLRRKLRMLVLIEIPMGSDAIPLLISNYTQKGIRDVLYRLECIHHRQVSLRRHTPKINNILSKQGSITQVNSLLARQTDSEITGGNLLSSQLVDRGINKLLSKHLLKPITLNDTNHSISNLHNQRTSKLLCDTRSILALKRHNQPLSQVLQMSSSIFTKIFARFMSTMQMNNSNGSDGHSNSSVESPILDPKGHRQVKINACAKLYSELAVTKPSLFGRAPKDNGIDFELSYYDSWDLLDPGTRICAPTVCLCHGAPGNYLDFARLIVYLTGKGVRVLAPNFPNYSATYEHSFRHSPRERQDYLKEFFKALGIKKIDMLIGHSSAVYTIFELLNQSLNESSSENCNITISSLGLFSTPTYDLPPNMAVTPFRLITLKLFDYPIFRPLILALITTFVKLQGIQNKVDPKRIENLLIAASAVGYSDCSKMKDRLKLIRKFKVPTFLLIGCNDRLIPMRCFETLKRDLGVEDDTQVKHYSEDGLLTRDVRQPKELIHVSQFESGGHYAFKKFWRQVNEDVYKFLNDWVPGEKTLVESTRL